MPKRLLHIFRAPRRAPAPKLLQPKPVAVSPADAALRNYARMDRAALARERRAIDGR